MGNSGLEKAREHFVLSGYHCTLYCGVRMYTCAQNILALLDDEEFVQLMQELEENGCIEAASDYANKDEFIEACERGDLGNLLHERSENLR